MGIAFDCGAGPATDGYIGFRCASLLCPAARALLGRSTDPHASLPPVATKDWIDPGPFAQFASGDVVVGGRWGQFVRPPSHPPPRLLLPPFPPA